MKPLRPATLTIGLLLILLPSCARFRPAPAPTEPVLDVKTLAEETSRKFPPETEVLGARNSAEFGVTYQTITLRMPATSEAVIGLNGRETPPNDRLHQISLNGFFNTGNFKPKDPKVVIRTYNLPSKTLGKGYADVIKEGDIVHCYFNKAT